MFHIKNSVAGVLVLVFILSFTSYAEEAEVEITFVSLEACDEYLKQMLGYIPIATEDTEEEGFLIFHLIDGKSEIRAPYVWYEDVLYVLDPRGMHSDSLEEWSLIGSIENPTWDGYERWYPVSWIETYLGEKGLELTYNDYGSYIDLITSKESSEIWALAQLPYIRTTNSDDTLVYYVQESVAIQYVYDSTVGIEYYYAPSKINIYF